ncbi:WD repeat-containing protein 76 [Genypterus blacodes]|uniref:WD repeat-containing protein 76 n=1 Tax=Genypterus blacodes TaxID=154954 RepID=UPI003F75EDAA
MPELKLTDKSEMLRRSTRQILVPERPIATDGDTKTKRSEKRKRIHLNDEENIPSLHKATKKEEMESSDEGGHGGLSAYELERLENIRQNKAFLSSMNLTEIKTELNQSTQSKPSQRGLRRANPRVKEVLAPRKSMRLQNRSAEVASLGPELHATPSHGDEQFWPAKKPPGPLPMDLINMEEGSRLPSQLIQLCSEDFVKEEKMQPDLKEYCAALKTMRITEENVAKVVKDRIFSAAFHPCTSSLLMATGDKSGQVGLWNLGGDWGDDGVLLFKPHNRPVPCMAFSRVHPQLLSLSYDGSLRCMDVEKAMFDDVYDTGDGLKTFDFMSSDCLTLVVGDMYGDVVMVDRRTPGNSYESLHQLDTKCVRCVSVHPVHKQYFAVAESSVVSVYDSRHLRRTKSQSVSQLLGHSLSISSAYFSPSTGNRVVTTCMDDKIRIFDTSSQTASPPLLTSIRHNMHTGRWLSKLSAVWDPKREDCFVVGSMERPRRMKVFHQSGELLHTFTSDEHITTVQSVTAFHPTRNALLGGNGSGRMHVLTD